MIRKLMLLLALCFFSLPLAVAAQDSTDQPRAETGGAQTLEDILRRQRGEEVDPTFRQEAIGDPAHAAPLTAPLGTLGGASDPELWRSLRYGSANVSSQIRSPGATETVLEPLRVRARPLAGR